MRVHGIPPAKFLATCAAVILLGTTAFASNTHPAQFDPVAQTTATPSPTPSGDNSDQNGSSTTPAPTSTSGTDVGPNGQATNAPGTGATLGTPIPMMSASPMPPGAPAGGTPIDIKQGGTTGNSNGPNWLDKFNRNPGPDTSGGAMNGAPANAHGMMMRVKHCTNMKTHKPMPCPKGK